MRKFSISYETVLISEAIVEARTLKEAEKKAKEVLGHDIKITDGWEVTK